MTTHPTPSFGQAVEQLRKERGLGGAALARRAGISRTHLWQICNGAKGASFATAAAIAAALDVPLSTLNYSPSRDAA